MAAIKKVVAKKPLAKAQTGKAVSKSKTYNQQLMEKFPKMSAKDTLPENSYARSQFYAPNRYEAAKQKVDRENEFNDEMGESRNRSKKELNTMNKTLDGYVQAKKRGGAVKPKAQLGAIVKAVGKGAKAVGKGISKLNEARPMMKYSGVGPKNNTLKAKAKIAGELAAYNAIGLGAAGKMLLSDKTKSYTNSKGTKTTVTTSPNKKQQVKVQTASGKTYYKKK